MATWKCPCIINFLGIGANYTLIMEYAAFGPLDKYLRETKAKIKLLDQLFIAVQIVDALEYLVRVFYNVMCNTANSKTCL